MSPSDAAGVHHLLQGRHGHRRLIDRVMADDRLNANPRVDEATHRVSPAGFRYYVTELAGLNNSTWAAP